VKAEWLTLSNVAEKLLWARWREQISTLRPDRGLTDSVGPKFAAGIAARIGRWVGRRGEEVLVACVMLGGR